MSVLRSYKSDFVAFAQNLVVPSAAGPARFGDIMADYQRETFRAMAPALHALAAGETPSPSRFWIERTKDEPRDTGQHERASTHGAGLKGHDQSDAGQPP